MTTLVETAAESARDTGYALERILSGEGTNQDFEDFGYDADLEEIDTFDLFFDSVLEMYPVRHGDTVVSVTVVIGTGGPHQEFQISENGETKVIAQWSGGALRRHARYPVMAELVWGYAEASLV